jgi:hypothetical protein
MYHLRDLINKIFLLYLRGAGAGVTPLCLPCGKAGFLGSTGTSFGFLTKLISNI